MRATAHMSRVARKASRRRRSVCNSVAARTGVAANIQQFADIAARRYHIAPALRRTKANCRTTDCPLPGGDIRLHRAEGIVTPPGLRSLHAHYGCQALGTIF